MKRKKSTTKTQTTTVLETLAGAAARLKAARAERIKLAAAYQRATEAEAESERAYGAARAAVSEAFPVHTAGI